MDFLESEIEEILNIFREESEEQIQKLNKNLLKLENNPKDNAAIVELFREAHSLKGAARMIGLNDIQTISHKLEDVFGLAKEGHLRVTSEIIDILCKAVDYIGSIVDESIKTRGQASFERVPEIVETLEYVKNLDNLIEETETKEESTGYEKTLNSRNPEVNELFYLENNEEIFRDNIKLIKQAKINIDKIKIFSNNKDAIKELFGIIKGIEQNLKSVGNIKLIEILAEIKNKLDISLKENRDSLSPAEISDIESNLNIIILFFESVSGFIDQENDIFSGIDENYYFTDYEQHEATPPKGSPERRGFKQPPEKNQEITQENIQQNEINNHEFIIETKDLKSTIEFIKQNIGIFSVHSVENISKFESIIEKLNELSEKVEVKDTQNIIEKIIDLLLFSKEKDIPISSDIVAVIVESFEIAVSFFESPDRSDIEAPVLIVQRLAVLNQMLKFSASDNSSHFDENPSDNNNEDSSMKLPSINNKIEVLPRNAPAPGDDKMPYDMKKEDSNTIKTLRVDTKKLDQLVSQVGELIIAKIKAKEHLFELEKIIRSVEDWYRDWNKTKQYFKHIDKSHKFSDFGGGISAYVQSKNIQGYFEENSVRLSGLMNRMNYLYKIIQEDDTRLDLIVNELEEKIKNVRVLPLATIFHMFPRMVRDIARERNKNIDLVISGSETSVDKKIIEEIKSPLIHIVRNSIDHGIEDSETRMAKGKSPIGKILLAAYPLENSVLIEIIDDGRGIDIEAIKRKVLQKQLLTPEELESMTEEQIMNIIFWPGFSTGETVTDISGRGIGLDIVYTKISQLNGKVKIKSVLGESCKVSIQLPVTMATIKSFLVEVNRQKFAIPTSAIVTTLLVPPENVFYKEGKKTIIVEQRTVPIVNLSSVLEMPESQRKNSKLVIIVIQSEDIEIGFVVDKLLGDQEILHKNLSPPLLRVRNIAGLTILGSGELCIILNINDLVKSAFLNFGGFEKPQITEKTSSTTSSAEKRILVVDDSLTTRILERNLLKAAGYNVTVAVNGLEALTKMITEDFDIVISDIEMPEINGFELVEHLRNEEKHKNIPIILLTSLASEADRKRGLNLGANAYITKGNFNQEELLTTVKKLLG